MKWKQWFVAVNCGLRLENWVKTVKKTTREDVLVSAWSAYHLLPLSELETMFHMQLYWASIILLFNHTLIIGLFHLINMLTSPVEEPWNLSGVQVLYSTYLIRLGFFNSIYLGRNSSGVQVLRLKFLRDSDFWGWNSSGIQVFETGILHGNTPQEHVSWTGCVHILNAIAHCSAVWHGCGKGLSEKLQKFRWQLIIHEICVIL